MTLINWKYLAIDWGYPIRYRKFKFRHNRKPRNLYLQILWLEVTVWYR